MSVETDEIVVAESAAPATPPTTGRTRGLAAFAGVVAGGVGAATASVTAVFTGAASNPVTAVGSFAIDLTPPGLKDAVIAAFGTGDKTFLIVVVLTLVAVLGALAGVLGYRRTGLGVAIAVLLGAIGIIAATTRADAGALAAVPAALGLVLSVVVLTDALRRLRVWVASETEEQRITSAIERRKTRLAGEPSGGRQPHRDGPPDRLPPRGGRVSTSRDYDRRAFFGFTITFGVLSIAAGIGARAFTSASEGVQRLRSKVGLPTPATTAPAVPDGADLKLADLTSYVTPNDEFYRIDTALQVPALDPSTWSLKIGGMVDNPFEITWAELLKKPLVEHYVTLACVSNEVGGGLIGNAKWLGYPLRMLLAEAQPRSGADMVLSTSSDGFTAGTPLSVLQEDDREALLAIGMNGQPLPLEHGFPARLVVPGLFGYVSATKWVTELKVTTFAKDQGYWTPRGWTARGPVKTEARIDRPRQGATVPSSGYRIAGVAWDQHTGIRGVEVKVDDGAWQAATLADTVGPDTWRQWYLDWDGQAGDHDITVRATNADGDTQTTDERPPAPAGASGYPTASFRAE